MLILDIMIQESVLGYMFRVLILSSLFLLLLAPTGALEEGILFVRACVHPCMCHFNQKNIEKEF